MLVVDASVMLELTLRTPKGALASAMILHAGEELHAPHLLDVEFTHTLRRMVREKELDPIAAQERLRDFLDLTLKRHAHTALIPTIWALRDSLSAYDAVYVALAESLAAPLITCDGRLSRSHGHRAEIRLIA
jgi:predicted nucleic acid-binding protein